MGKRTGRSFGSGSIFRGKVKDDPRYRVQGVLTPAGRTAFESAAKRLAALYRRLTGTGRAAVSDADTIEYLARGEAETVDVIESAQ